MIRVHDKQLGEMEQALGLEQFEDEMVVHLRGFVPRHAEVIGDDWVRRSIRFGIQRARGYGVINPGLLRFYVELMFLFGGLFDADPLFPWAGEILRDPSIPNEVTRIDRLYEATWRYLDATGRLGSSLAVPMLRSLKQLRVEDLSSNDPSFEKKLLDTLASIDARRCAYVGEPLLRQLIRRAPEVAARHDLAPTRGIVLVTGMMFMIGHGFAGDPTFPWIEATLCHPAIKDPTTRALRQQRRTEIYVDKALKHFERQDHVRV